MDLTNEDKLAIIRGWYLSHTLNEPTDAEKAKVLYIWNAENAEHAAIVVFDSPAAVKFRTAFKALLGI